MHSCRKGGQLKGFSGTLHCFSPGQEVSLSFRSLRGLVVVWGNNQRLEGVMPNPLHSSITEWRWARPVLETWCGECEAEERAGWEAEEEETLSTWV